MRVIDVQRRQRIVLRADTMKQNAFVYVEKSKLVQTKADG